MAIIVHRLHITTCYMLAYTSSCVKSSSLAGKPIFSSCQDVVQQQHIDTLTLEDTLLSRTARIEDQLSALQTGYASLESDSFERLHRLEVSFCACSTCSCARAWAAVSDVEHVAEQFVNIPLDVSLLHSGNEAIYCTHWVRHCAAA